MAEKETAIVIRVWASEDGLWRSSFQKPGGEEYAMLGEGVEDKDAAIFHALNGARNMMAEDTWASNFVPEGPAN